MCARVCVCALGLLVLCNACSGAAEVDEEVEEEVYGTGGSAHNLLAGGDGEGGAGAGAGRDTFIVAETGEAPVQHSLPPIPPMQVDYSRLTPVWCVTREVH